MTPEKMVQAMQASIETAEKKAEAAEKKAADLAMKNDTTAAELKKAQDELAEIKREANEKINLLQKSIEAITASMECKRDGERTFVEAFADALNSTEIKSALQSIAAGNRAVSTGEVEVKLDSATVTADAVRTVNATAVYSDAVANTAFMGLFGTPINVPQDKNRIMWNEGAYTSNAGYVEELAEATADTASLEANYREVAKIGAYLPFSAEMAEDFGYFLAWAQARAMQNLMAKVDTELLSGDGNDSNAKKHIYGLKAQGTTAFNAATAGLASAIENANIADVIAAAKAQAQKATNDQYIPDVVSMNPSMVARLRALKNTIGDYLYVLPNGQMTIHGLRVNETSKLGDKEILLTASNTLQFHQKRNVTMEIERVQKTDSYNLNIWWRGQALVPTSAKKGNIYIADVDTAMGAITKA
jgi:hypothetical protein